MTTVLRVLLLLLVLTMTPALAQSGAPLEDASTASPSAAPSVAPSPSGTTSPLPSPRASASAAQPPTSPTPHPAASPSGPTETAGVVINHIEVLRVPGKGDLNAKERAQVLVDRLEAAIENATDVPEVTLDMVNANPVLACEGIQLITVTDQDALAMGVPKAIVAVNYRTSLEAGLGRVWKERNGLLVATAVRHVALALLIGLCLHLAVRWAAHTWLHSPGWFGVTLVWIVVGSGAMLAFPVTRGTGQVIVKWLVAPMLKVLCIAVVAFVVWVAGSRLLQRYFTAMLALRTAGEHADSRAPHRINAIMQASRVALDLVLAVLVLAALLNVFNVNASTVLASAGIIGVAVGVAAQDLLRDMVAGLAILVEDQFGVGDFIKGGGVSGEVVGFTLRATRIRNTDGSLVTVPNTLMRVVENQSNEWAQADVQLRVSPGVENVRRALAIMEKVGAEMLAELPDRIVEMPTVLGTERVSPSSVTLRMLVKTAPSRQWGVRRDMLARLCARFEEEGIRTPRSLLDREKPAAD